jgi:hypothetical protein
VAQELTLSFVPDAEQRLWRTVMRRRYQLTRNRVQLQSRLEALLEEAHLKLSSLVSDLLGTSARRSCRPWGMARRIRPLSRRSLISGCARRLSNSPMRSRPAPRCIPCTGDS